MIANSCHSESMVTLRTAPSDPLVAILEARGQATELAPDLLSLVAPHWAVPGYDSVKSARPRSTSCQFINKRALSSKISGVSRYNSCNVWPRTKPSPKDQWSARPRRRVLSPIWANLRRVVDWRLIRLSCVRCSRLAEDGCYRPEAGRRYRECERNPPQRFGRGGG